MGAGRECLRPGLTRLIRTPVPTRPLRSDSARWSQRAQQTSSPWARPSTGGCFTALLSVGFAPRQQARWAWPQWARRPTGGCLVAASGLWWVLVPAIPLNGCFSLWPTGNWLFGEVQQASSPCPRPSTGGRCLWGCSSCPAALMLYLFKTGGQLQSYLPVCSTWAHSSAIQVSSHPLEA